MDNSLCETLRTLRETKLFHAEAAEFRRGKTHTRHPEFISGSIYPLRSVFAARWMLKQVQHDEALG
jgi:hypothetical protein